MSSFTHTNVNRILVHVCVYICLYRVSSGRFDAILIEIILPLLLLCSFFFGNLQLYGNFVSHKQYGIISETMTFDQIDSCLCVFILNDDMIPAAGFFFFTRFFFGCCCRFHLLHYALHFRFYPIVMKLNVSIHSGFYFRDRKS